MQVNYEVETSKFEQPKKEKKKRTTSIIKKENKIEKSTTYRTKRKKKKKKIIITRLIARKQKKPQQMKQKNRIVSLTSLLENLGCLSKVCSKPDLITSGLNFVLHPKMAMI